MQELWKAFPLDARYEVSTLGRVRRASNCRIRKTPIKQNGYPGLVFTHPGGSPKGYDLHYMVAVTWIGPRPAGYDTSHQDGNKLNNCLSNLKYETRKENANKHFNNFTRRYRKALTKEDVRRIRKDTSLSNQEWAIKLKVGRPTIWKVRNYVTWKYV